MKKYKTISEVLMKGQLSVNGPVTIILVIIPVLSIFITPLIFSKEYIGIGILLFLILSFVLAWLWWSYKIVKWRIWAFENVKKSDWNDLKQRAIIQKLIWDDGSIFEKTEIRSKADSQIINEINAEIEKSEEIKSDEDLSLDKVKNDPRLPSKIEYSYKRIETVLSAFLPVILVATGAYLISVDNIILGVLSIGMIFYYTNLHKIKDVWKKEIQFSISNDGIELKKFKEFGFVKWDDTQDISVDTESGILRLGVWEKEELFEVTFNLNDYPIKDYDEFLRKINVYLKRNSEKRKR